MQIILKIKFNRIYYPFFYSRFILVQQFCKKMYLLSNGILSVKVFNVLMQFLIS